MCRGAECHWQEEDRLSWMQNLAVAASCGPWGVYPRTMLFIMPLLSRVLGYIVISSNDDEYLARVLASLIV